MEVLRWLRTIGDTIFLIGVGALAYFVIGLVTGCSYEKTGVAQERQLESMDNKQPALSSHSV